MKTIDQLDLIIDNNMIKNIDEIIEVLYNATIDQELFDYLKNLLNRIYYATYTNKDELVDYLRTILIKMSLEDRMTNYDTISLLNEYFYYGFDLKNICQIDYLMVNDEDGKTKVFALPTKQFLYEFLKENANAFFNLNQDEIIELIIASYKDFPKPKDKNREINREEYIKVKEYLEKFEIQGNLVLDTDYFGNVLYIIDNTVLRVNDGDIITIQGNTQEKSLN